MDPNEAAKALKKFTASPPYGQSQTSPAMRKKRSAIPVEANDPLC
jgi:hypothetical protein